MTLEELIADAKQALREWAEENPLVTEPHDEIFDIADSSVPVYTSDLMRLGAENLELATTKPELGPAFDGEPTPANIIAANIFEHIEAALWEEWRVIEEEKETAEQNLVALPDEEDK